MCQLLHLLTRVLRGGRLASVRAQGSDCSCAAIWGEESAAQDSGASEPGVEYAAC